MVELYIARNSGSGSSKIDISSATVTLASGTLTYDGTLKTKTVTSVEINGQTLVEGTDYTIINNAYTNAGDYTLTIMGMGNYKSMVTADWSIVKATGSVIVSPTTLSIQGTGETDTATLTVVGDGTISVNSSDTSVATVERSGNTLTVTSVSGGTANITITLAAGANYTGSNATLSVSVAAISSTLSDNTPEQIQAAAQAGNASALWSVGDVTAPITISAVSTLPNFTPPTGGVCAFIIGFDHNSGFEGTGIHFQFGKTTSGADIAFIDSGYDSSKTSGTWFNMNDSSTNANGWNSSKMRNTICPAFLSALPTAWQNVIAYTYKYTDNTGGGSSNNVTQSSSGGSIWLLSEYEVFGAKTYAASTESSKQVQYDYYKNGNSKIKYKHNTTTSACVWWLRSPRCDSNASFCHVSTVGNGSSDGAAFSLGFAPGFRIAGPSGASGGGSND